MPIKADASSADERQRRIRKIIQSSGKSMKRIIVLFDGTWSSADDPQIATNVVKLARALRQCDDRQVSQIVFYNEGIGTTGGWLRRQIEGVTGLGIEKRIKDGYRFVAQNYEPGDEIHVFGYSRGAFEARSMVGFICLCGLLRARNLQMLSRAWQCYQVNKGDDRAAAFAEIRAASAYPVSIRCIGVWDTVGNLGIPTGFGTLGVDRELCFHDTRLHPLIDSALHALAIDEPRGAFKPTLWTTDSSNSRSATQVVEQVWFPGSHSDVGGGWTESGLSDLSLLWMVGRAEELTGLAFDRRYLEQSTSPSSLAAQHSVTTGLHSLEALLPYFRTIRNYRDGIGRLRRMLLGRTRAYEPPSGETPINESVDVSAMERYGRSIEELRRGRSRRHLYKPPNLPTGSNASPAQASSIRLPSAVSEGNP